VLVVACEFSEQSKLCVREMLISHIGLAGSGHTTSRDVTTNQIGSFRLKNFHWEGVAGTGPDANILFYKDVSDGDGNLNAAGERAVVYLSFGVGGNLQFDLDFSELLPNGAHTNATVLDVASPSTSTDYDAASQIRTLTKADKGGTNGVLTFQSNPYEVIQIVFTYGAGVKLRGDDQTMLMMFCWGPGSMIN
jgi:hypothetical protein